MNKRSLLLTLALIPSLALFLPSCYTQTASGGTGGTGMSMGSVTGFGSVFVNGIEYHTNRTTLIDVDGVIIPESQHKSELGVGMVVKVNATRRSNLWTADSIRYRSDVIGPAETKINAPSTEIPLGQVGTLEVLGKTVTVTTDTQIALAPGATGSTPDFATLLPDAMVKVTGFPDFAGNITATRIEWDGTVWDRTKLANVKIRGKVVTVPTSTSFQFDGTPGRQVTHDGTIAVAVNDWMWVSGGYDGTAITAAVVEKEDRSFGQGDDEFEIEGILADRLPTNQWIILVNGYEVDISEADGRDLVTIGDRVEVEGEPSGSRLIAEEVELKHLSDMELRATIQSHDATLGTLTLLGRTFLITPSTAIEDKAGFFAKLVDGSTRLSVHAYRAGLDYVVTEARFDATSSARLKGLVESVDTATQVTISGIPVTFSNATTVPATYTVGSFLEMISKQPALTVKLDVLGTAVGNGIDATAVTQ